MDRASTAEDQPRDAAQELRHDEFGRDDQPEGGHEHEPEDAAQQPDTRRTVVVLVDVAGEARDGLVAGPEAPVQVVLLLLGGRRRAVGRGHIPILSGVAIGIVHVCHRLRPPCSPTGAGLPRADPTCARTTPRSLCDPSHAQRRSARHLGPDPVTDAPVGSPGLAGHVSTCLPLLERRRVQALGPIRPMGRVLRLSVRERSPAVASGPALRLSSVETDSRLMRPRDAGDRPSRAS